ncbi:hypothetical protein Hanom_Chr11g01042891 [Helianthus anomalus]
MSLRSGLNDVCCNKIKTRQTGRSRKSYEMYLNALNILFYHRILRNTRSLARENGNDSRAEIRPYHIPSHHNRCLTL